MNWRMQSSRTGGRDKNGPGASARAGRGGLFSSRGQPGAGRKQMGCRPRGWGKGFFHKLRRALTHRGEKEAHGRLLHAGPRLGLAAVGRGARAGRLGRPSARTPRPAPTGAPPCDRPGRGSCRLVHLSGRGGGKCGPLEDQNEGPLSLRAQGPVPTPQAEKRAKSDIFPHYVCWFPLSRR